MTAGYEPRFDLDNNVRGLPGERYASAIRDAIWRDRIEVKTDWRMIETGNVYIEYEQKTRTRGWQPSGIAVTEADLWLFASPSQQGALVVQTSCLKEVARMVWGEGASRPVLATPCPADAARGWAHENPTVACCPYESAETRPTHGIKVPVQRLMAVAWFHGRSAA